MNPKYSVSGTGPKIEEYLRSILASGGFDLGFTIEPGDNTHPEFENPDLVVKFTGQDVDLLLGNRGELLLALELVTQEMLRMHSDDHSRISFDANDNRALRIEELRVSALTAAENVIRTGTLFRFNPMNSRERRVIHIALRHTPEVRSESAGSGPVRGVIIYPAGMPSLPESEAMPPKMMRSGPPGDRGLDDRRPGSRPVGGRPGERDRRPGGPRPPR